MVTCTAIIFDDARQIVGTGFMYLTHMSGCVCLCVCACYRCSRSSVGRLQWGGGHPAADPCSVSCETHTHTCLSFVWCQPSKSHDSWLPSVGQEELLARPSCWSALPLWHGADVSSGCSDAGGGPTPQPHALRPRAQTVGSQYGCVCVF